MEKQNSNDISNRYDFVYLFEVVDGNPNGDPDAGNSPRIDPETRQGLVSDVCLKRKIRNYVQAKKGSDASYRIFISEGSVLNNTFKEETRKAENSDEAADIMCRHFYDVRTFGAVLTGGKKNKNAGQVRGPVQITFARSVSPIWIAEHAITRMAKTGDETVKKQESDADADDTESIEESDGGRNQTMGRKYTIPYGLYLTHGFVSASLAKKRHFTKDDLDLLFEALKNMFDVDHSAARGLMRPRRLIVFKHSTELGNAPSYELFDRVQVHQTNPNIPPRSYDDYDVKVNDNNLPEGVTILNEYDIV